MPPLRRARSDDWNDFIALDTETGRLGLHDAGAAAVAAFDERWPQVVREHLGWGDDGPTRDGMELWVLEGDGGGYAGHLLLSEQADPFSGVPRLFVLSIAVVAACRRQGHGDRLMRWAITRAGERGYTRLALAVDAANDAARRLYERHGLAVTRHTMECAVPARR